MCLDSILLYLVQFEMLPDYVQFKMLPDYSKIKYSRKKCFSNSILAKSWSASTTYGDHRRRKKVLSHSCSSRLVVALSKCAKKQEEEKGTGECAARAAYPRFIQSIIVVADKDNALRKEVLARVLRRNEYSHT